MDHDGTIPDGMSDALRRVRTLSVHGGHLADERDARPVVAPIVTGTALASRDPDAIARRIVAGEPTYNRDHFVNATMLEGVVADLEGAEAGYATSSGMAAISLVVLAMVSQGGHIVLGAGGYSDTEELFTQELSRFGVACTVVDLCSEDAVRTAIRSETAMIFAETIANPGISIADIPMLAGVAREAGIPLVVDNTLPTPALCRPLEHGADLVVHSATKFLGGHHDLSAGVVVGSHHRLEDIRRVGYLLGSVPGAHDAALAVRGIRTLAPRMIWISRTAQIVAEYLVQREEVAAVRYPGLGSGRERVLASRLFPDGCGGVMVVEFAGPDDAGVAESLVRAMRLIPYVTSLGGDVTSVCFPPRLRTDYRRSVPALRFSIGLEDPGDLIADLDQAFVAIGRSKSP